MLANTIFPLGSYGISFYTYIYIIYIYIYIHTTHILSIYDPYTIPILSIYYPYTIHLLSIYYPYIHILYSFICLDFIVSQWVYKAVYSWGHHIFSRKCDFSDIKVEVKVKTMLVGSAVELGDMGGKCEKCWTWASPWRGLQGWQIWHSTPEWVCLYIEFCRAFPHRTARSGKVTILLNRCHAHGCSWYLHTACECVGWSWFITG